jgi:hypothetical protein
MSILIKKVKRNINKYYKNIYNYNEMDIKFNKNLNLYEFISYNIFILPKCIFKLIKCNQNDCIITIEHFNGLDSLECIFVTSVEPIEDSHSKFINIDSLSLQCNKHSK